jgi:pilus assembly protein CpaC
MNAVTLSEHVMKGSKMNISSWKNLILSLMLIVGLAGTAMAQDNTGGIVRTPQPDAELEVPLYKSRILSMPASIKRISVGSPDIADLLLLRSTELYVLGKDLGTTNVLLWDAQDVLIAVVSVEVTHDLDGLKKKLHDLMPNEAIEVRAAQRSIVLSGTVSSPTNVTAAVAIAKGYLAQAGTAKEKEMFEVRGQGGDSGSGEVINLLQVGGAQQVDFPQRAQKVRHALQHDAEQQSLDDGRSQRRRYVPRRSRKRTHISWQRALGSGNR